MADPATEVPEATTLVQKEAMGATMADTTADTMEAITEVTVEDGKAATEGVTVAATVVDTEEATVLAGRADTTEDTVMEATATEDGKADTMAATEDSMEVTEGATTTEVTANGSEKSGASANISKLYTTVNLRK